jgi:hypothetical protein
MITTGFSLARSISKKAVVATPKLRVESNPDLARLTPAAASIPTTAGATPESLLTLREID